MIHVIATVEVHSGKRAEFLAAFHQLMPLVHAEVGCVEYGPTVDAVTDIAAQGPRRDDVVVVVEKWTSLEALQAHLIAPHMTEYRTTVKSLVKSTQLQVLEPA